MHALATIHSRLDFLHPRVLSNLLMALRRWIDSSGQEWTVSRLKEIKVFFLQLIANPDLDPRDISLPFFLKDKNGLPRGPFTFLSRLYTNGDYEVLIRALQMYTPFHGGATPTEKQLEKFWNALLHPEPADVLHVEWLMGLSGDLDRFYQSDRFTSPVPKFEEEDISSETKSPSALTLKSEPSNSYDQLYWLKTNSIAKFFGYGKRFHHPNQSKIARLILSVTNLPIDYFAPFEHLTCVGKISYLQEPGFKLRAIANPGKIFQLALTPLGRDLYETLRLIPEDCTFDQSKGIEAVLEHFNQEDTFCASVDLSSATDQFPFRLTRDILLKLNKANLICMRHGYDEHLALWVRLAMARWHSDRGEVRWKKGQPLGLYPSFPAFALSHHYIIRCLWNWINPNDNSTEIHEDVNQDDHLINLIEGESPELVPREPRTYPYRILGDDIVIFDKRLAKIYQDTMKRLGCPISLDKTFNSRVMAEFAGSTIIASKGAIKPGKWHYIDDDNFMDVLKAMGPSGFKYLRPKQRSVAKILAPLPEPVGCGWNPEGIPMAERIESYLSLFGMI